MTTKKKLTKNLIDKEHILFAHNLADIAGDISKKYFRNKNVKNFAKIDESPVTIADTEIETALRLKIKQKYPEHGICGEEFDNIDGVSPFKWYIDPIDGTSSFICGLPIFTNLIALLYYEQPIFGIINQPILNERWSGGISCKTSMSGIASKPSSIKAVADAVFSTTSPYLFDERGQDVLNLIRAKTKYQKYGGVFCGPDSYQYAMLTSGFIDIILEENLQPHDFLPLVPIIENAGAVITDWQGNNLTEYSKGRVLASSNKILHQKILEIIN
jgi:inositol-phosphate phosphatase/L-galactose 1-phosphate phosphatase/histidinol-phosphatase